VWVCAGTEVDVSDQVEVEVDGQSVKVTNADKVLFPDDGITKGDLVAYYRRVADAMLPHLEGRPLSLQRFPDGIDREGFFQQEASDYFPAWVRRARVPRRGGGTVDHVVCDNAATLVYLANQATVTLHAWTSRVRQIERPDRVVFDLDPPGAGEVGFLRELARRLREILDELGLAAFVQTSGSKGFHVVAPLRPSAGFDQVSAFAEQVAGLVAAGDPERVTVERRKAKRAGRVFIDTGRNAWAQTAVAPYSVRPRPGAPVATPIDWSELGRTEPRSHTLRSLPRRLARKRDPWAGMDDQAGSYRRARERLDRLRARGGNQDPGA
jgi:bifunctional non-homologous end joining protein LigD